jgi:3-oxoacyl-[acyl-carrier-protein] synthase II
MGNAAADTPTAVIARRSVDQPSRRVVVTGIGLATPLGHTLADFTKGLFAGGAHVHRIKSRFAEPVPGMRVFGDFPPALTRAELTRSDRTVHLSLLAGRRALEDAGWRDDASLSSGDLSTEAERLWTRCAVLAGNSSGPTQSVSESYAQLHATGRLHAATLLRCMPSGPSSSLAMRFGLRGPNQTITSACASSTVAIGEAVRAIRHGYISTALVGGTEAPFADGTLKAWEALRMLAPCGDDPQLACRPFDVDRRGLVLGEAAVFFVLEDEAQALSRGATVHAVLAGYGAAADAYRWTEPASDGQVSAMRCALDDAGIGPEEVALVNAYGTGTVVGDSVEAESIARVFGCGRQAPWVYSTKSLHGHALGASGALELAALIATLKLGAVPATRNLDTPTDLPLNLVYREPRSLERNRVAALSNSFAFGGSNACLVVTPS